MVKIIRPAAVAVGGWAEKTPEMEPDTIVILSLNNPREKV